MRNVLEVLFGLTFWLGVEVGDTSCVLLAYFSVVCSKILIYYVLIDLFGNQLLGVSGLDEDVIVND